MLAGFLTLAVVLGAAAAIAANLLGLPFWAQFLAYSLGGASALVGLGALAGNKHDSGPGRVNAQVQAGRLPSRH